MFYRGWRCNSEYFHFLFGFSLELSDKNSPKFVLCHQGGSNYPYQCHVLTTNYRICSWLSRRFFLGAFQISLTNMNNKSNTQKEEYNLHEGPIKSYINFYDGLKQKNTFLWMGLDGWSIFLYTFFHYETLSNWIFGRTLWRFHSIWILARLSAFLWKNLKIKKIFESLI